ncbi:hypothetical protein PoB_005557000 [Plakobranchus ocellatus]|uniref:Uncharacterized protein n=1 Tax=Plakobranchus ocellatus TaxID=259542 RepID=A0AAV4C8M3_9GAST|nr:hypothetical protein PoB_005557000 [Plakobranchus ocellatus]
MKKAWDDISTSAIANCFRNAGFYSQEESSETESETSQENRDLVFLFDRLKGVVPADGTLGAFLYIDEDIPALPQDVYSKRLCCLILKMLEEEPDERPDAYEILFKTSEIRSKRYEPGDLETKLDIKLDFREVIIAVTEFTENTVSSNVSVEESHTCDGFKDDTDSKETVVHRPRVAKTNRHSAGSNASGSSNLFENLQRDTFGTITNKKAQRRMSSGHSVSEDSATPTWGSDSFLQENSSESSLNPLHRRSFPKISELPEADQSQKETCRPKEKVTGSTSKSRGKQDSKDGSLNELVKSTLNVFAEQTDSLKELMVKRATGDQSYKVDGEAMLNHQPF